VGLAAVAWLSSLSAQDASPGVESSQLCVFSLLVAGFGVQLRVPLRWVAMATEESQAIAILASLASWNWIGFVAFNANSFSAAAPSIGLLILAEWLVTRKLLLAKKLPLLADYLAFGKRQFAALSITAEQTPVGGTSMPEEKGKDSGREENVLESDPAVLENDKLLRSLAEQESPQLTSVGMELLADGEQALQSSSSCLGEAGLTISGSMQIRLEPGQDTRELGQGFSPVFQAAPDIEFELSDENMNAKILQLGPLGFRVQVTRKRGATGAMDCQVDWYAFESEQAQHPALP